MNANLILKFIEAINSHKVGKICEFMTEDHLFIDSQDNKMVGKENLKPAWISYFSLFPDYKIEVQEILERESLVVAFGYASGTYNRDGHQDENNFWRIPAAWRAIVKGNFIKEWQVYVDNSRVLEIISK